MRLIVLGTAASTPYAGMAWMHMQIAADILETFDATRSDYGRHSRTRRDITAEYFRTETVLARLLDNLGL